MKLKKAMIYYFDPNDENVDDKLDYMIDRTDLCIAMFDKQEVEAGKWHDDIDLNMANSTKETFEKYFKGTTE